MTEFQPYLDDVRDAMDSGVRTEVVAACDAALDQIDFGTDELTLNGVSKPPNDDPEMQATWAQMWGAIVDMLDWIRKANAPIIVPPANPLG